MKKVAMYRRGRGGPNDGLKEKIVWLLSTGPMTGRQLHVATKLPLRSIRALITHDVKQSDVQSIQAMQQHIDRIALQCEKAFSEVEA